jgi:hypothetical protein
MRFRETKRRAVEADVALSSARVPLQSTTTSFTTKVSHSRNQVTLSRFIGRAHRSQSVFIEENERLSIPRAPSSRKTSAYRFQERLHRGKRAPIDPRASSSTKTSGYRSQSVFIDESECLSIPRGSSSTKTSIYRSKSVFIEENQRRSIPEGADPVTAGADRGAAPVDDEPRRHAPLEGRVWPLPEVLTRSGRRSAPRPASPAP